MIKALIHENGLYVYIVLVLFLLILCNRIKIWIWNIDIYDSYKFIKLSKFIPCSTEYLITVGKVKFVSISPNNVLHAYKADPHKKVLHFPNWLGMLITSYFESDWLGMKDYLRKICIILLHLLCFILPYFIKTKLLSFFGTFV